MHPRTEALLTLRDGEPIDAQVQAQLLAEPGSAAELARLRRMKEALGALPELAPPEDGWERIEAELDRHGARRFGAPLRWAASGAIAVTVAVAAMLYLARSPEAPQVAPPAIPVAEGVRQRAFPGAIMPASYVALVEESARLERMLARIPYQRPMMTAGTASTIVGLEDRIALIDEQLTFATANDMEVPQRQALWGERVDLMNALVHVRFAQAQPTGF